MSSFPATNNQHYITWLASAMDVLERRKQLIVFSTLFLAINLISASRAMADYRISYYRIVSVTLDPAGWAVAGFYEDEVRAIVPPGTTKLLRVDLRIGADFRASPPQYHAEEVEGPGAIKDEIHAALRWVDEGFGDYSEETRERFNQREEAIAPEQKVYIVVWDEERHVPIAVTRILDPRGGQIFIEKDLLGGQNLERRAAYLELGVELDALELGRTRIDSAYVGGVSALLKGTGSYLTFRNPDLNFYNNHTERYQIWLFAENAAREPPYEDHPLSRHGFQFVGGPFSETPVDPEVLVFEINARNLMDRHFFTSRLLIPRKRLAGPSSAKICAKLLLNDGASRNTARQSDP